MSRLFSEDMKTSNILQGTEASRSEIIDGIEYFGGKYCRREQNSSYTRGFLKTYDEEDI